MTEAHQLRLVAYSTGAHPELEFPIVTASPRREWMRFQNDHAYRCLPLTMANQMGWFILNPIGFVAEWQGDDGNAPIKIVFDQPLADQQAFVRNIFGNGILTWTVPYLFRTPPGYNLLVRGPANWLKDGVQALEGMVESDWIDAPFTMSWKITRSCHPIRFDEGDPFCMITPVKRGEIEQIEPTVQALQDNPALHEDFRLWREQRRKTVQDSFWRRKLARAMNRPPAQGHYRYELNYMHGQTASGSYKSPDHQTRLALKPFRQAWQKRFHRLVKGLPESDAASETPADS